MSDFKEYSNHGVYVAYPENWTLQATGLFAKDAAGEAADDEEGNSLTVTSPNGAFWLLKEHPPDADLDDIADDVLQTMQELYNDMEVEQIDRTVEGIWLSGYEMNFFYLDLINMAKIQCFTTQSLTEPDTNRNFALFWQTGDQLITSAGEGDAPTEDVFEAMTIAMLRKVANSIP